MKRSRLRRRKLGLRRVSPRRRLEIDLDRHARLACISVAGGVCQRCGSTGPLEWHHVVSRRTRALRWLPENALALCVPCHRRWHAHPRLALAWFVERFGEARLAALRARRNGHEP